MKRYAILTAFLALGGALFAQGGTSTGLAVPMATVKLIKTEIISDKSFREDVAKYEKLRGSAMTADERRALLDELINDLLFYQMCERDGIKVSDGEVEAYLVKLRAQMGPAVTQQQFEAYMESQGIPMSELKSYYKKQMLIQRWLTEKKAAEVAAIPAVTTEEVIALYELNKSKLVRPDTVRIVFVFAPFKDTTEAERAKAAELIRSLSERLARGESFDALRLRASEGGYMASADAVYIERSETYLKQFTKPFFDMVFSMRDATVSIPFETEAGWWIVRRVEFFPQKQLELSDPYRLGQPGSVQEQITSLLTQQKQNEFLTRIFADLFVELRAKAEIKIIGTP